MFRGATTSYELQNGKWSPNLCVRLKCLSDLHREVVDTWVKRWSQATPTAKEGMNHDLVELAQHMYSRVLNYFEYEVVGTVGGCRTCGVLRFNQLVIRQATPKLQFCEPLLKDKAYMLAMD